MTDRRTAKSISPEDLIEHHMRADPAFRDEWERGAFAREVAHAVIRYRIAHELDIDQLARRLGIDPETVDTLEVGEDDPDVGTLRLLSERLGFRFTENLQGRPVFQGGEELGVVPPKMVQ